MRRPDWESEAQLPWQQSDENEQSDPSGAHDELAPLGLQMRPRDESLTQWALQQSDEKLHEWPSGLQVQSEAA